MSHFSEYIKNGIEPENLEEIYKKAHAAIRADPSIQHTVKHVPKEKKHYLTRKLTYEERKAKLIARLNALNAGGAEEEEEEDDDE